MVTENYAVKKELTYEKKAHHDAEIADKANTTYELMFLDLPEF
jgi:hypothetical protein